MSGAARIFWEMNEQKYKRQAINEYLLGSLPEAEAERFDELSITDDEFADSLAAAETDLVDDYVRGELAGATLENFESHYLASPLRRERVEFARTFQSYAARNTPPKRSENFACEKPHPDETPAGFLSSLDVFRNKFSALQWSFGAALLLLIVFGGFGIFSRLTERDAEIAGQIAATDTEPKTPPSLEKRKPENSNAGNGEIAAHVGNQSPPQLPPPESDKEQIKKLPGPSTVKTPAPSVVVFILAPPLRSGADQIKTVSIRRGATEVNALLELESADYPAYRVALADESGTNLWRSGGALKAVGADENKRLKIPLPARLLKNKIYTLTISGINSGGEAEIIGDYPFRVELK